jgi:NitT/TauT family transport system permease protein
MSDREPPRARGSIGQASRLVLPLAVFALVILVWDAIVRVFAIEPFKLPGPGLVFETLWIDRKLLWDSLLVTLAITVEGFVLAVVGGVVLAVLFNLSRLVEYSFYPYAVILQVTPVVAIAPLLVIWLPPQLAVLACAWIVAFFPMLANTTLGLRSVDRNLVDLFRLYGASRWGILRRLELPWATPYILTGVRIAGGLALVGAVVAEMAVGTAGAGSGLAFRITESAYRLNVARMFAALALLSAVGVVIYFALAALSHAILHRWHESAIEPER